ncbi:site-2 protease family protein [Sphaerisporangium perillae]|uniref:site-2 protease family protein n=1 Tax=Sphaerisporangium perillae TaxID=2935860 RepID=UPI00200DBF5C|nr:site-2 protease family protein [Sphaerisporangium perillae]
MRQNLRLGHVAGIPVGAHWSTVAIAALIGGLLAASVLPEAVPGQGEARYWIVAVAASVVFLGSLLGHELAHALVARRRGITVKSITLWLLGGVTEFDGEAKTPKDEFLISAAGPLASLVFSVFFFLVILPFDGPALVISAVRWLALMNGMLAVFNMLPGAPLDGGRVLHAALWRRHGDRARADRSAAKAGQVLGMTLIAIGGMELILLAWTGGLWMMLIGWFLVSAARSEGVVRAAREGLQGWRVRDVMTPSPDIAPGWQNIDDFIDTVALRSRQLVFPVVDFGGQATGVLSLEALTAMPPEQRHEQRVTAVSRPLPPDHVLSPDDDATRILGLSTFSGDLMAVVADPGHVVGMVTTSDLSRALQQAILRTTSTHPPTPPTHDDHPSLPSADHSPTPHQDHDLGIPTAHQEDHDGIPAPRQEDHDGVPAPRQEDHDGIPAPRQEDHDGVPAPRQGDRLGFPEPDQDHRDRPLRG